MPAEEILCTCACGRSYDAAGWAALSLCGYQQAEDPDELIELRGCLCGSHRAIEIPGPGFWLKRAAEHAVNARQEAHEELHALSAGYTVGAITCLRQAEALHKILLEQRARRERQLPAQAAQAAE